MWARPKPSPTMPTVRAGGATGYVSSRGGKRRVRSESVQLVRLPEIRVALGTITSAPRQVWTVADPSPEARRRSKGRRGNRVSWTAMAPGAAWAAGAPAAGLDDAGAAGAAGVGGAASGGGDLPSAEAGSALQKRRADASPAVGSGVSAIRSDLMGDSSRRWECAGADRPDAGV